MGLGAFGLPGAPGNEISVYTGNSVSSGVDWQVWQKPKGRSMVCIFLLGQGGHGGTGAIGANSTAAGGGGGGSGGQAVVTMPLYLLPDELYISLAIGSTGAPQNSFVSVQPDSTVDFCVAKATGGGVGGNAAGATAGGGGAGAGIVGAGQMPIGFGFAVVLAGQAGIIGGVAVAGAALTLPVTGLRCTGGAGGGGLGAAGVAGKDGGSFTVPTQPGPFPAHIGGVGGAAAGTPPSLGSNGYSILNGGMFYGGTGGGSTHGTATGAGLVQAAGGDGGYGSGGGGMGGALTASSAAATSRGGSALCIITCW